MNIFLRKDVKRQFRPRQNVQSKMDFFLNFIISPLAFPSSTHPSFLPLFLPLPPFPSFPLLFSFPFPFPLHPLTCRLGSAVSSPSGVWVGTPAEIEFGAFQLENLTSGDKNYNDFPENQQTKFNALHAPGKSGPKCSTMHLGVFALSMGPEQYHYIQSAGDF